MQALEAAGGPSEDTGDTQPPGAGPAHRAPRVGSSVPSRAQFISVKCPIKQFISVKCPIKYTFKSFYSSLPPSPSFKRKSTLKINATVCLLLKRKTQ